MALTRNDKMLILAAVLLAGAVVGALAWWRTAGRLPEPPAGQAEKAAPSVEHKVEAPQDARPAVTAPIAPPPSQPQPAQEAPLPVPPATATAPHPEPDKSLSEIFNGGPKAPATSGFEPLSPPPAPPEPEKAPEPQPAPAQAPAPEPEKRKPETQAERRARQAAERKAAAEAKRAEAEAKKDRAETLRRAQEELRKAEAELKRAQAAQKKAPQKAPEPAPQAPAQPVPQPAPQAIPQDAAPAKPEQPAKPQTKVHTGPERRAVDKITAVSSGNETVFTLAGASTSSSPEALFLANPPRLVVDLPGEWAYRVTEKPAPEIVKAVRVGKHPDKLRLVLDLADTYKSGKRPAVEKTPEGLVIRLAR